MDKVHPLTEAVARAVVMSRNGFISKSLPAEAVWLAYNKEAALKDANAAIRAVLTFEPTREMTQAADLFFTNQSFVNVEPAQRRKIYEAMTAALLKEAEGER